jgi:hypothetical protein
VTSRPDNDQSHQPSRPSTGQHGLALSGACTAVVALGAAWASYRHGRDFAHRFGADPTTATIWPLIVDGLLILATIELWRPRYGPPGSNWAAWLTFAFGICLSLTANIAAAPAINMFTVTVAVCPPLALLLAVEMLNRAIKHHRHAQAESLHPEKNPPAAAQPALTAEQRMRAYYLTQQAHGRTPTGAELDRVAGTRDYGRRLRRKWLSEENTHSGE